jgi:hypothetical protein
MERSSRTPVELHVRLLRRPIRAGRQPGSRHAVISMEAVMFGSAVLDVAIGLIVVFILFATICTTVREGLDAWLKTRAAFLERGIRELLNDANGDGLSRQFYEHPLIYPLFSGKYRPAPQDKPPSLFDRGGNLPSYIPSRNFALALMDIVARGPVSRTPQTSVATGPAANGGTPGRLTLANLQANATALQHDNDALARAVISAVDAAQGDLDQAMRNIEQWFDSAMERVSGWYRRKTNLAVFFSALVLAVAFNVDTINIASHFYRNPTVRLEAVALAERMLKERDAQASLQRSDSLTQLAPAMVQQPGGAPGAGLAAAPGTGTLSGTGFGAVSSSALFDPALQLPIGWTDAQSYTSFRVWPLMIAGWLLTALAATLGAPFWFDVLNKVMNVRSTIKADQKDRAKETADAASLAPPDGTARNLAPGLRRMSWTPAAPVLERRRVAQMPFSDDATSDIDGCGHAEGPLTDDKDLPPAQGGMK